MHHRRDQLAAGAVTRKDKDGVGVGMAGELSPSVEQLRELPRTGVYLGAISKNHKVITSPRHRHFARWGDLEYVALFNRSVYATYMQGAAAC